MIAIVIAIRDVHYGWTLYAPVARAAGLTDEQLLLLREGRAPRDLPPEERALCDYVFEITACRRVPPRVAEAIHEFFHPRQIVDIALLTAHLMSVVALAIALEVEPETQDTVDAEIGRLPPAADMQETEA